MPTRNHPANASNPPRSSLAALVATAGAALALTASTAAHAGATVIASGPAPATFTLPSSPAKHGSVSATCPAHTDAKILDLTITTPSLSVSVQPPAPPDAVYVRLILPSGWTATTTRTWPVLYLLTGHGASYASWTCDTFIEDYVEKAGVIVVMPDGTRHYSASDPPDSLTSGIPGEYSDWESPSNDGSPEAWETFHLTELRQLLESSYHASTTRAIAGLSMGGLGAMAYAARHPGMFAAAASYSGFVHTNGAWGLAAENGMLLLAGQDTNAPWGYFPGTPGAALFGTQWPAHDPTELASALLSIPLFVSSGNGTPGTLPGEDDSAAAEAFETGVYSMNSDFVAALKSANGGTYPSGLTIDAYGNGTHSWAYWDAAVCRSLPMLMSALHVPYTPGTCTTP
jgi:diacylglycerol O-acyltransferase / trehalose O-mycolyltransferase